MTVFAAKAFYAYLDQHESVKQEALAIRRHCASQEEVMERFIALGAREGFPFTAQELVQFIFENGRNSETTEERQRYEDDRVE